MVSTEDITESVTKSIVMILGIQPDKVIPSARLVDDLGMDSLEMVELAMELEEALNLPDIDDDQFEKLDTVADVVGFIAGQVAARAQVA